jgi:hypothetical protein
MTVLLDCCETVVTGSASRVSFQIVGGGHWEVWNRYIAIDGKNAFQIGNLCGTCSFFFERLHGAYRTINVVDVVDRLAAGVTTLNRHLVEKIQTIMPDGKYMVLLTRVMPNLIRPLDPHDYFANDQIDLWGVDPFRGLPHDPKTEYYRLSTRLCQDRSAFYEFLIPIFPQSRLHQDRIASYISDLQSGHAPTAIALSVLDVKQPAVWDTQPAITSHWCLAHYLLDGHHKVVAASKSGLPLTLLTFLAIEEGVSSGEQVEQLVKRLNE